MKLIKKIKGLFKKKEKVKVYTKEELFSQAALLMSTGNLITTDENLSWVVGYEKMVKAIYAVCMTMRQLSESATVTIYDWDELSIAMLHNTEVRYASIIKPDAKLYIMVNLSPSADKLIGRCKYLLRVDNPKIAVVVRLITFESVKKIHSKNNFFERTPSNRTRNQGT